jgi:hypothetical protein
VGKPADSSWSLLVKTVFLPLLSNFQKYLQFVEPNKKLASEGIWKVNKFAESTCSTRKGRVEEIDRFA